MARRGDGFASQEASMFQEPELIMREQNEAEQTAIAPGPVAEYIAQITAELAALAKQNGFDSLSYILDMARLEAAEISKSTVAN
jgi:hypothetical protein